MSSIINRFILKILIKNGLTIFLTINSIFILMNFTKISARLSKFGLSFFTTLYLSVLSVPLSIFQTINYVLFLSIFISINSIFKSNELIIFKALGNSYKQLMKPIITFSFLVFLLAIFTQAIFPITMKRYTNLRNFYNSNSILYTMKKDTFNVFNNSVILFRNVDKNNNMKDIIMIKNSEEEINVGFAHTGEIDTSREDIVLKLKENKIIDLSSDMTNLKISENKNSEVSLVDHFEIDSNGKNHHEPIFKSTIKLLREEIFEQNNNKIYKIELHSRLTRIIQTLLIGFFCGLFLIKRNTSRIVTISQEILPFLFFGYILFLSKFLLPTLIIKKLISFLYLHHVGLLILFFYWFFKQSSKENVNKF